MEEDPNIFPPFEAFYITSLLFCTESALSSASAVMDLLEENQNRKFEFPPRPTLARINHRKNI